MTWNHVFFLTWITITIMAVSLTFVFSTFEGFLTFFSALENCSLFTAFGHSFSFPAITFNNFTLMFTRGTFSTMTELRAQMRTERTSLPLARFTTWVWFEISIRFRILELSAKTVVLRHIFLVLGFALDTVPSEQELPLLRFRQILISFLDPHLNTFQM